MNEMNILDELLKEACRNGNLKDVSILLRVGANINCQNGMPLLLAIYHNHTELAEYLLQADADGSIAYIAAILQQNGGHARILTEYKQNPCKDPYLRQLAFQLSQIATDDTGYDWNELFKKLQEQLNQKFENTNRQNWVPPMPIHAKQSEKKIEEKSEETRKRKPFFWFLASFPFPLKKIRKQENTIAIEQNESLDQEEKKESVKSSNSIPTPQEVLKEEEQESAVKQNVYTPKVQPKSQDFSDKATLNKKNPSQNLQEKRDVKPLGSVTLFKEEGEQKKIEKEPVQTKKETTQTRKREAATKKKTVEDLFFEAVKKGEVETIKMLLQLVENRDTLYQAFKISIQNNFFASATALLEADFELLHWNEDEVYKSMLEMENEKMMKFLRKKDPEYSWPTKDLAIKEEESIVTAKTTMKECQKNDEIEDIYANIDYDTLTEEVEGKTEPLEQDQLFQMLVDSIYQNDQKRFSYLATKVSSQDTWNRLALWAMENCEEEEILQFILQYVNIHDGDEALLAAAVSYRNYAAAKVLLDAGANANARAGMIMILSARNKDEKMVRLLSNDGFPALEEALTFAINHNNRQVIDTIKKAQVDVSCYLPELEKLAKEKGCPMILNSLRKE